MNNRIAELEAKRKQAIEEQKELEKQIKSLQAKLRSRKKTIETCTNELNSLNAGQLSIF